MREKQFHAAPQDVDKKETIREIAKSVGVSVGLVVEGKKMCEMFPHRIDDLISAFLGIRTATCLFGLMRASTHAPPRNADGFATNAFAKQPTQRTTGDYATCLCGSVSLALLI